MCNAVDICKMMDFLLITSLFGLRDVLFVKLLEL